MFSQVRKACETEQELIGVCNLIWLIGLVERPGVEYRIPSGGAGREDWLARKNLYKFLTHLFYALYYSALFMLDVIICIVIQIIFF